MKMDRPDAHCFTCSSYCDPLATAEFVYYGIRENSQIHLTNVTDSPLGSA
jgi:hypothetical protein